jgi:LysM repeat protein
MYDSRLGRFLSVDAAAVAYPALSTYQFAGNTPIQAIDIDGREADYSVRQRSDGYTVITITIDLKIYNKSSQITAENIKKTTDPMIAQIKSSLSVTDEANKIVYETKVRSKIVTTADATKDFYFELTDKVENSTDPTDIGYTDKIGNPLVNRFQIKIKDVDAQDQKKTAAHEVGHGLGMKHPYKAADATAGTSEEGDNTSTITLDDAGTDNLMRQSRYSKTGTVLVVKQLELMITTISQARNQYIVKKGDTVYSIAKRFGTTVDNLTKLNGLDANARIAIGQKLKLKEEEKPTK